MSALCQKRTHAPQQVNVGSKSGHWMAGNASAVWLAARRAFYVTYYPTKSVFKFIPRYLSNSGICCKSLESCGDSLATA